MATSIGRVGVTLGRVEYRGPGVCGRGRGSVVVSRDVTMPLARPFRKDKPADPLRVRFEVETGGRR